MGLHVSLWPLTLSDPAPPAAPHSSHLCKFSPEIMSVQITLLLKMFPAPPIAYWTQFTIHSFALVPSTISSNLPFQTYSLLLPWRTFTPSNVSILSSPNPLSELFFSLCVLFQSISSAQNVIHTAHSPHPQILPIESLPVLEGQEQKPYPHWSSLSDQPQPTVTTSSSCPQHLSKPSFCICSLFPVLLIISLGVMSHFSY